jgi:hypothetical protein
MQETLAGDLRSFYNRLNEIANEDFIKKIEEYHRIVTKMDEIYELREALKEYEKKNAKEFTENEKTKVEELKNKIFEEELTENEKKLVKDFDDIHAFFGTCVLYHHHGIIPSGTV